MLTTQYKTDDTERLKEAVYAHDVYKYSELQNTDIRSDKIECITFDIEFNADGTEIKNFGIVEKIRNEESILLINTCTKVPFEIDPNKFIVAANQRTLLLIQDWHCIRRYEDN